MSRAAKGEAYEREIRASLLFKQKFTDLWFKKLVDTNIVQGAAGKVDRKFNAEGSFAFANMMAPKVPSDFLVVYKGRPVFLECKTSVHELSYNVVDYVKEHQCQTAKEINRAGGLYFFLICDKSQRGKKSITSVYNGAKLFWMRRDLIKHNKRSIKWEALKEQALYLISKETDMKNDKGVYVNPWPLDFIDQEILRWQKQIK